MPLTEGLAILAGPRSLVWEAPIEGETMWEVIDRVQACGSPIIIWQKRHPELIFCYEATRDLEEPRKDGFYSPQQAVANLLRLEKMEEKLSLHVEGL